MKVILLLVMAVGDISPASWLMDSQARVRFLVMLNLCLSFPLSWQCTESGTYKADNQICGIDYFGLQEFQWEHIFLCGAASFQSQRGCTILYMETQLQCSSQVI